MYTIDQLIGFLVHYKEFAYAILFLGSMFETIIGISFFVFGEIFFLSGSILAGMGILNIWIIILVLYSGGILGDNISYFLGRKYGISFYNKLKKIRLIDKFINEENFVKGSNYFKKYGALSVFLGRLLGPLSWITPFIAGTYKLEYKKFLPYEMTGAIIGIGQFIIAGYFFGKHFDVVIALFETYIFVVIFIVIICLFILYYIKKKKILKHWKDILNKDRKKAISFIAKDSFKFIVGMLFVYLLFLFFIFFIENKKPTSDFLKFYDTSIISTVDTKDCNNLGLYYKDSKTNTIQPINIILNTSLDVKDIFDDNWIENDIFRQDNISFSEYVKLIRQKSSPVSSLYFIGLPQNFAYQYKTTSLSKREHIRLWQFSNKKNNLKTYYASISYDDGYQFGFYNYFITPLHKIDKNIDKSRDFFYKYLLSRKDWKMTCKYEQTKCSIKEINGDNEPSEEQRYYTDGKILKCKIQKKGKEQ
ncbi:LssY C-terminal domain-containing protein [Sulfurospirillum sp. 1307]